MNDDQNDDCLLGTPDECTMVGYGSGASGQTVAALLVSVEAQYGPLENWQREAMLEGHRTGMMDLATYLQDMANMERMPGITYAEGDIPF